jgi:hypothetical protein
MRCQADCKAQSLYMGPAFYLACVQLKCEDPENPELGPSGIDVYNDWGSRNFTAVKTLKTERYAETGSGDTWQPPRNWVLFEVVHPVTWDVGAQIGVPTPAEGNITTSDDTVQKPPPEPGLFDSGGALELPEWVPWVVGGTVVVVGIYSLAKLVRG